MAVTAEPVWSDPNEIGGRVLLAAPGDPVPSSLAHPAVGIVSRPDPVASAVEPLPGYDAMTEAAVVAMLPTLPPETLAAVQAYEQAHQARGAIHRYGRESRVVTTRPPPVSVPAESTSSGYDSMSSAALDAELAERQIVLGSGTGAGGAILKVDKVTALQEYDAAIDGGT